MKKVGENKTTSNLLTSQKAFMEMNPADYNMKYPVGFFIGDIIDPNGQVVSHDYATDIFF